MSDEPVQDVARLYSEGDPVRVVVLDIDLEKKRLSLGLKQSYFDADDISAVRRPGKKQKKKAEERPPADVEDALGQVAQPPKSRFSASFSPGQ
jgi:rRNA biogenesis protein RRP5